MLESMRNENETKALAPYSKWGIKNFVQAEFWKAGITINGNSSFDPQIKDDSFFRKLILGGILALGEMYVDEIWDVEDLCHLIYKMKLAELDQKGKFHFGSIFLGISNRIQNKQNRVNAWLVGQKHYDLGNDIFEHMLGRRMVYSCAYWDKVSSLDEAQENKLDLICKKLGLKPGMSVLDIGCGFGSFANFAAEKYGVEVFGITVSKEQKALGEELSKGLPVKIETLDFRDLPKSVQFDRVVSIGMFEHVGVKNYRVFMETVFHQLKEDGLFLLHTIGMEDQTWQRSLDPWTERYIFPNASIPCLSKLSRSFEKLMLLEDLQNFGYDYYKTLVSWYSNFSANWHKIEEKYGSKFYRVWKYYLLVSAGCFQARKLQVWQLLLSKNGVANGYRSFR